MSDQEIAMWMRSAFILSLIVLIPYICVNKWRYNRLWKKAEKLRKQENQRVRNYVQKFLDEQSFCVICRKKGSPAHVHGLGEVLGNLLLRSGAETFTYDREVENGIAASGTLPEVGEFVILILVAGDEDVTFRLLKKDREGKTHILAQNCLGGGSSEELSLKILGDIAGYFERSAG